MNEEKTGKWLRQVEEKLEDTRGVIKSCQSKKDRQHNGQKKKGQKQRSTKHTYKPKDRVT